MRNKKATVWIFMMTVCVTAVMGCGGVDHAPAPKMEHAAEENLPAPGQSGENEDESGKDTDAKEQGEDASLENSADANAEDAYLIGYVKSIDEDSIVVSQSFTEGEDMMVAPTDGSEDEVLVTVYLSESTQYEVETVKNGGLNGDADVEKRQGDASDLRDDVFVEIFGYHENGLFRAEKISISLFV